MMKNFMEIGGMVKKIYSYPPKNILEGNGVVFENFTINHGNGGWSKQIIHTPPQIFLKVMEQCSKTTINHGNWGGGQNKLFTPPPNILEGNGAVFKTTINHGNWGGGQNKLFTPNILEGNGVVFENFTINH